jgi:Fe-S-cluster containining protein
MSIRCPYLNNDELCSIYETRPSCCRNFPNRTLGMFCSETKCVYDALGNLDCANCKDKCCSHLEMEVFDIKLLDISCSTCKEVYCAR